MAGEFDSNSSVRQARQRAGQPQAAPQGWGIWLSQISNQSLRAGARQGSQWGRCVD